MARWQGQEGLGAICATGLRAQLEALWQLALGIGRRIETRALRILAHLLGATPAPLLGALASPGRSALEHTLCAQLLGCAVRAALEGSALVALQAEEGRLLLGLVRLLVPASALLASPPFVEALLCAPTFSPAPNLPGAHQRQCQGCSSAPSCCCHCFQ